jgi:DNA-binding NarL/FixJ family response regulator
MDEAILARVTVPVAGVVYTTTLTRPVGRRAYTPRDGRLVERLHAVLAPLLGRELLVTTQPNLHGLSPRLRELLERLLVGDSEKEVALWLGLSAGTVHQYVKQVYRHFGVSSRAELMAYFLRRYRRPE